MVNETMDTHQEVTDSLNAKDQMVTESMPGLRYHDQACDVCGLRHGASGQRTAQPVRQTAHKHSGKVMGSRPQGYTPQPHRSAWSGEGLATRSISTTNIRARALPDPLV